MHKITILTKSLLILPGTYTDDDSDAYTNYAYANGLEESCNTKTSLCLYKNYATTSTGELHSPPHHYQVQDNNNYNYAVSQDGQYTTASCSSHNISMISSACYTTTQVSYPEVGYNTVYPMKDVNKNYEEVRWTFVETCSTIITFNMLSGMHRDRQRGPERSLNGIRPVHVHQAPATALGDHSHKSSRTADSYTLNARPNDTRTRSRRNARALQPARAE